MSNEGPGNGWWQASDGHWYPPEQHPDVRASLPPPPPQPLPMVPAAPGPLSGAPEGAQLRTVPLGPRLGGYLLNSLLMLVTLWVGWLIWALILTAQGTGQTPAKQLLGHQVVDELSLQPLGFAGMFFIRGLVVALIMNIASLFLLIPAVVLLLMPFFREDKATIWELASGTRVVYVE